MNTPNDGGPADTCKCIDCGGSGRNLLFLKKVALDCDRCKGTGEMPAIMNLWKAKGEAHRLWRIGNRETLRDFAKRTSMDVMVLSHAERGIIDPETVLPARKEGRA